MAHRRTVLALACVLAAATTAWAADWPQWRGPNVDGIGRDALPAGQPRLSVAWTASIGVGYAAATVADGRVYTAGWSNGRDTIFCFDADTGKQVWTHSYPCGRSNKMHEGGPAATPAVHDGRVYTLSREGQMFCLDAASGKVVWEKNLARELSVRSPEWDFSGSPVVDRGRLLIDIGMILAIEPSTGRIIWQSDDYGAAYSTPVAFEQGGKRYLAVFPRSGLVILDAGSGREIARHRWETSYGVNAATPIVHDGRIFITSGYNTGCALLAFNGRGLAVLWESREMRGQMATPVLIGEHLYGFDESQLKCMAWSTGERAWAHRGLGKGAIAAAGQTLVIQSEDGDIILAPATPAGYREIARVKAFDARRCWVMPTVANGRIFARSPEGALAAIDIQ